MARTCPLPLTASPRLASPSCRSLSVRSLLSTTLHCNHLRSTHSLQSRRSFHLCQPIPRILCLIPPSPAAGLSVTQSPYSPPTPSSPSRPAQLLAPVHPTKAESARTPGPCPPLSMTGSVVGCPSLLKPVSFNQLTHQSANAMRCVLALLVALLGLLNLVAAAPRITIPLASQQPPVARVGQDFLFSILPGSFASNSTVTYAATSLPPWLQFSPSNPAFYGKPTAADVGQYNVTLAATDATGTANSTFTLIVSNYSAPILVMDFDRQIADPSLADIASAKVMPGGNGVSVPPYWSFALGWNGNMFKRPDTNGNGNLFYTAHVRGTAGLPDWLIWSNTTFTFNGVAPANGSYEVVVTASDYWNYTATSASFVFSVGDGAVIENSKAWPGIKTTSRSYINHALDLSGMLLNGEKLDAAQVEATPDLSSTRWLSYDNTTRTISGVTPDALVNGTIAPFNVPVTLSSANSSNTLSYVSYLNISVLPYAFTDFQLSTTNVPAGQTFQFDVSKYLVNKTTTATINATVVPGEAAAWLLYHPDNYTLVGTPPANITYTSMNITFMADAEGAVSSTNVTMPIDGVTGPQGEGEPAPIPIAPSKGGLSKKNKIIIGVVVGVVGLLILLAAILCCCCLRKRKAAAATKEAPYHNKEGTPETLVNTPNGKKSLQGDGASPVITKMSDSPRKYIKGLFGTVNEPSLPTINSKDSAFHSSRPGSNASSFMCAGELLATAGPHDVGPRRLSDFTQSAPSAESLASWESQPSMHWSGEDEYLEPLYESEGFEALSPTTDPSAPPPSETGASQLMTPTFGPTLTSAGPSQDKQGTGSGPYPSYVPGPQGDIPRPRAGFVPSYPRWIKKGERGPPLSSDDVSLYFSEFDKDNSSRNIVSSRSLVASRSLDSFAGQGSEIVGTSSGSRLSHNSQSNNSNAWWKGSNMSSLLNRSDDSYAGEAVVATAQRQSLDTQRSSLLPNEVIDFTGGRDRDLDVDISPLTGGNSPAISAHPVTPTTPDRPVSYLVVPSYVHPMYSPPKNASPARRHSSSRRTQARVSPIPTRDHILRGEPPAEVMYSAPLDKAHGHAL
ncbi:hypothetical protein CC85DRAFT_310231 [Cutaneotrichosporon oleaginosum]|uniref:Dystroglycan-type cadherin-like domain-containing protein n=1 Tax=Cutaneotrichosporon oleaginosum TaxID=879819 RepID=A0A0J0XZ37_9TREE|nr:uncharacterized protein CC85DRAFT_310231 [Cutaneotrichosporon oleaginosum]KLT46301.1 hypothetical protein CC85DRAFT_310231 [Cutaneotrichosporon oleaginosum]